LTGSACNALVRSLFKRTQPEPRFMESQPPPEDKKALSRLRGRVAKVLNWRRNELLRSMSRNMFKLLLGEGAAAPFALLVVVLTARGLGPAEFGLLVLGQNYCKIIEIFTRFQSWQIMVRYGAEALARNNLKAFQQTLLAVTFLDAITAVAAAAIAYGAAGYYAQLQGLGSQATAFLQFQALALLTTVSSTPTGLLRMFDRYDLLAKLQPINPAVRLVGTAIVFFLHGDLWAYTAAWLAGSIAERLSLVYVSWRQAAQRDLLVGMRWSIAGLSKEFPDFWKFAWSTNFISSFMTIGQQLDRQIIALLLDVNAVGLYEIAARFSNVVWAPYRYLRATLYPELAQLWANYKTRTFWKLVGRVTVITFAVSGVVCVVYLLAGELLIRLLFGPQYLGAYMLLMVLAVARTMRLGSMPFVQALSASGRTRPVVRISGAMTFIAIGALWGAIEVFGLLGAGVARLAVELMTMALMTSYTFRHMRMPRQLPPA
jgi:O-antigen/teichoic acid export membrane protein